MAGTFSLLILSLRAPIPSSTSTCTSTSASLIHSDLGASLGFHGRARSVQGRTLGPPSRFSSRAWVPWLLHKDWSCGGGATQAGLLSNLWIWRSRARICDVGEVELLFKGATFVRKYLTLVPVCLFHFSMVL